MQADLDKRFRNLVQEGRKCIKDYITAKNTLQKTRDKYYRYCGVVSVLIDVVRPFCGSWLEDGFL